MPARLTLTDDDPTTGTWRPRTNALRDELRQVDAALRGTRPIAIKSFTTHPRHWAPPPSQKPATRKFRLRRRPEHVIRITFDKNQAPDRVNVTTFTGVSYDLLISA